METTSNVDMKVQRIYAGIIRPPYDNVKLKRFCETCWSNQPNQQWMDSTLFYYGNNNNYNNNNNMDFSHRTKGKDVLIEKLHVSMRVQVQCRYAVSSYVNTYLLYARITYRCESHLSSISSSCLSPKVRADPRSTSKPT
jgi:hypothetical protein